MVCTLAFTSGSHGQPCATCHANVLIGTELLDDMQVFALGMQRAVTAASATASVKMSATASATTAMRAVAVGALFREAASGTPQVRHAPTSSEYRFSTARVRCRCHRLPGLWARAAPL